MLPTGYSINTKYDINMLRRVVFVISLLIFRSDCRRWHTSQVALTQLYDLQTEHFDVINNYLDLERKRLEELKSDLAAIYERHDSINDTYTHNHINTVKLVTRVYQHLRQVEELMCSVQSIEVLKEIDDQKDLSGDHISIAVQGIRRLQRFYMIPAADMAAGRHENRTIGDQMDACDCYVVSKYCFEEHDMYGGLEWAIEAYEKWKIRGQHNIKCVDIEKLKFYIVSSSAYTGFDSTTLLNRDESRSSEDTDKFQRFLQIRNKNTKLLDGGTMTNIFGTYILYYDFRSEQGESRFRELCKYGAPERILTKYSKCRYQTKDSPHRILMPFKEEDISSDPYIKIYHDVLYDEEISNFKNVVSKNMIDAQVLKLNGSKLRENDRSGQLNWIDNDDVDSRSLNARIESFTGFSSKSAEPFQIVNYGLGGHYIPHHDTLEDHRSTQFGDRIVTVLFYLNDVHNDGSTVFPLLDVISPAEKGAALVWLNLNTSDGSSVMESLHGSCPILKGNKWIMTRWLYEEGQQITYDWRGLLKNAD